MSEALIIGKCEFNDSLEKNSGFKQDVIATPALIENNRKLKEAITKVLHLIDCHQIYDKNAKRLLEEALQL